MTEIPVELINRVKLSTRKAAGLSNYNPSDPSLPALLSLSATIALTDSTESHLRCKNCKGRLLRGPQSIICLYCGSAPLYDEAPDPINFTSTIGYQWLLQSLHLEGSEMVRLTNKYDQDQGRNIPEVLTPLSEFLNLRIPWSAAMDTQHSNFSEKHETEHKRPWSSNGVPPDNFFLNAKNDDSSDKSFKESILDDFETSGEDFGSLRTQKPSLNVRSYKPADSSSVQKTGESSVGWAAEFQSADSENKHGGDIPSDNFPTASDEFGDGYHKSGSITESKELEVDFGAHIDSVFGLGKGLNGRKPNDSAADSTGFDDWDSDDMWKNLSSNAPKSGDRVDAIVRNSDDPTDDTTSDNWKDSSVSADLFRHSQSQATDRNDSRTQHKEHDGTIDDNTTDDWNDFTGSTNIQASQHNDWSGTDIVTTSENIQPQTMVRNGYQTPHKENDRTMNGNATDDWNDFTRLTNLRASPHNGRSGTALKVPTSDNFQPQTTDKNDYQTQHNEHDEAMDDDTIDEWIDFAGSTSIQAPPHIAWSGTNFHVPTPENFQPQKTHNNGYQTRHKEEEETMVDDAVGEWNDFAGSTSVQTPSHSVWSETNFHIPISENFGPQPTDKDDYQTRHKEHVETIDDDTFDEWNDLTCPISLQASPLNDHSGSNYQVTTTSEKLREMDLFGLHNKSEVSSGSFSEPVLYPTSIRDIRSAEELNYAVSGDPASNWLDDLSSPSHECGQVPVTADAVPQSSEEEVAKLISQMQDISFMLEADLSIPPHSPTPKD